MYWWHDKYRPRKPKYFNRVHTGYEWNKYNQTHYDQDNPPPKVVQVCYQSHLPPSVPLFRSKNVSRNSMVTDGAMNTSAAAGSASASGKLNSRARVTIPVGMAACFAGNIAGWAHLRPPVTLSPSAAAYMVMPVGTWFPVPRVECEF